MCSQRDLSAFKKCCKKGSFEEALRYLTEENISACFKTGYFEMIKYVCEKYGYQDLDYAFYKACLGSIEILEYLYSRGGNISTLSRCIEKACLFGKFENFKWMYDRGARLQNYQVITFMRGDLEFLKWLYENKIGDSKYYHTRLPRVCYEDQVEEVKWLVEIGADVNMQNGKPLIMACKRNNLGIAKYLHSLGANIHMRNNKCLLVACKNGHLEVVKWLVENGADINCKC